jgi:hypothetical protein
MKGTAFSLKNEIGVFFGFFNFDLAGVFGGFFCGGDTFHGSSAGKGK